MKSLKYIILSVIAVALSTSCEKNYPVSFNPEDTFVSFEVSSASLEENATEAIRIPIILAGVPGGTSVTATVGVSTEGIAAPAVEGEDFRILNKEISFTDGYGTEYVEIVPIDNNNFEGNKSFILTIESVTPELSMESVQNTVTITLNDDEHPLAYLFGNWAFTGVDPRSGTMVSSSCVIGASGESVDEIAIDYGTPNPIYARVEEVNGYTYIRFYPYQDLGVISGYTCRFCWTEIDLTSEYPISYDPTREVVAIYDEASQNIIFEEDGFGLFAFDGDSYYSFFELWLQGTVSLVRQ